MLSISAPDFKDGNLLLGLYNSHRSPPNGWSSLTGNIDNWWVLRKSSCDHLVRKLTFPNSQESRTFGVSAAYPSELASNGLIWLYYYLRIKSKEEKVSMA